MGQQQIFQTALTEVRFNPTTWPETPGTIRQETNGTYKYVGFSGTTDVAVGDVVTYIAYASDGVAHIVDQANSKLGAGIAMAAVASGSAATGAVAYATGWVRIRGMAITGSALAGSPGVGDALTLTGTTNATLTKAVTDNLHAVAFNYDATAKAILCNFPH